MRQAQALIINTKKLQPEKRDAVQKTQHFLRHTFRKILMENSEADIFEEVLYVEDPHIYATWTTQSCLLGAGFKIGARLQFDTEDGRLLRAMQGKRNDKVSDEEMVQQMQVVTDLILEHLQHCCQTAGLISGISQSTLSKAFSKNQKPSYQLRGGVIDSWLLRINDSVFYCTTHVIFDESRDIVMLGQNLPLSSN